MLLEHVISLSHEFAEETVQCDRWDLQGFDFAGLSDNPRVADDP